MVRIRLTRVGRKNLTLWRIGAFDARTRRDGRPIEYLGHYNPHAKTDAELVSVNKERAEYWLSKGAQPTQTVASLLRKAGVKV